MRTATIQGSGASREAGDPPRGLGIVGGGDDRPDPMPALQQLGDVPRVLLVAGDDQPGCVRAASTYLGQPGVGRVEHGGQPLALGRQRGAQALCRQRGLERIVEGGGTQAAVRGDPLHVTVQTRELDLAHDSSVGERIPVAVLERRHRLVQRVGHEGDRAGVRAKRGAGERESPGGLVERGPDPITPGTLVAGVVDLVEHHQCATRQGSQRLRGARDLLVGGHDAVEVRGQSTVLGAPGVVERQVEALRRPRPTAL